MSDVREVATVAEEKRPLDAVAAFAAAEEVAEDTLTQEDVDAALVAAEAVVDTVLEVRDIPGALTIAHSDDLEEWRRVRSEGSIISATAMTTVMGTNPFSSVMDLWRERMEGFRPTFSRFSLKVMNYGTLAEPELLEEANNYLAGNRDETLEPFTLTHGFVVNREDQRFGCTPDGWRLLDTGAAALGEVLELLELKTGSKSWRKTPRSKPVVPPNYYDQTQWQMLVTEATRVLVVYRQVKRDKQGNVLEVLGHEHIWVERDEKRIGQMVEAANAWLQDEADLVPPMTYIDLEDQFDDAPEVTAEKRAIRDALADLERADAILAEERYADAATLREESLGALKTLMRSRTGRQVILNDGRTGATLSRSTRTSYDASLLTEKQRERIRKTTTVETLRTQRQTGE